MPIPRLRISIARLLTWIALVAVTLTALASPSNLWANSAYAAMAATLVIFVLRAIYSRGPRRAFAVGFATCGWAFFLAHYGPEPLSRVQQNMPVGMILDILYPFTVRADAAPLAKAPDSILELPATGGGRVILVGAFGPGTIGNNATPVASPTPWEIYTKPDRTVMFKQFAPVTFRRIGINLMCLIFATLGGILTRQFYRTADKPELART